LQLKYKLIFKTHNTILNLKQKKDFYKF